MYHISMSIAPKMPNLEKRTEIIKIQFSQTSKDTQGPLFPMLFPILGAQMSGVEFLYPDLTWKDFVVKWPILKPKVEIIRLTMRISPMKRKTY